MKNAEAYYTWVHSNNEDARFLVIHGHTSHSLVESCFAATIGAITTSRIVLDACHVGAHLKIHILQWPADKKEKGYNFSYLNDCSPLSAQFQFWRFRNSLEKER